MLAEAAKYCSKFSDLFQNKESMKGQLFSLNFEKLTAIREGRASLMATL